MSEQEDAELDRRHQDLLEKQTRAAVPLWAIVLLVMLASGAVLGTVIFTRQLAEQARENCEGLNDIRQAELNLWRPLIAEPRPDATPAEIEVAERFSERLEHDFKLVSCDD